MMLDNGSRFEDLLSLISQSKKLLIALYEGYFSQNPLSYTEALGLLADDTSRFQALLDSGVIALAGDGIRLNPKWKLFLKETLVPEMNSSISLLKKGFDRIEEEFQLPPNAQSVEKIFLLLGTIHSEWERIFENNKLTGKIWPKDLDEQKKRWKEIVWKQLKKLWGIRQNWDNFIIEFWKEAEYLERRFDHSIPPPAMPDFIKNLAWKKRQQPGFVEQVREILGEEKALFWNPIAPANTRIQTGFFEQNRGQGSASRIRGRKKIPESIAKRNSDTLVYAYREGKETKGPDLQQLMEDFFKKDEDLKSHIKKHPLTSELSAEEQQEAFWECLFMYGEQLTPAGRGGKKWAKRKD